MTQERLYHLVADKIIQLINDGTYPSGSRLPGERELAERFEVSRVTIREAEIALQAMGYLSIRKGSGVYVLNSPDGNVRSIPKVSAFELTEARLMFESEATALAARVISDEALAKLDQLLETMSADDPDGDEASQQADHEFHLAIARASGNSAVQHVIESLWKMRTEVPEIREVHAAVCADETPADRGAEHSEILVALRNHDPEAARSAMQRHFRRLLRSMIDVTEENALKELREKASANRQRYLKFATHVD